jgi:hypothetical protein
MPSGHGKGQFYLCRECIYDPGDGGIGFLRNARKFVEHYVAYGGAVGRGTALQWGRSRVRFPMLSLTQPMRGMSSRVSPRGGG